MGKPLLTLILAFIFGLALAPWGSSNSALPPLILSLLLALSSLVFILFRYLKFSFFLLCLSFFFFAPFWYHQRQELPPHHFMHLNLPKDKIYVEGIVNQPSEEIALGEADEEGEVPTKTRIYLSIDRIKFQGFAKEITGTIRVTILECKKSYHYGDKIGLWAKIKRVRNYKNPGAFDFEGYMRCRGIYHTAWIKDDSEITLFLEKEINPFLAKIYYLQEKILSSLGAPLGHPEGPILRALVLGDRSGLTPQVNQAFIDSGTYHILAISGMNVAAVGFSAFVFLRLLWFSRKGAALGSMFLVNFYALLAGGSPSVIRAALMASLFFVALILERETEIYTILALSAFIILLLNPLYLFDIGFLLTFSATLAIVYAVPRFPCPWKSKPAVWLWDSLLVTLAASSGVIPILAYHFNRLSWVGILANLIVVPLSYLITVLGMAAGFLSLLVPPWGVNWLIKLTGFLVSLLYQSTAFFADWPAASFRIYTPTIMMIIFFYISIYSLSNIRKHFNYKILFAAGFSFFLFLVIFKILTPYFHRDLRITFLDVGQGECTLVELPRGKVVMIDGGGSYTQDFDVGERVVAPYLWHQWIRKIDLLIISYTAPDHIGGLPFILEHFAVKEVWDTSRKARGSRLYWEVKSLIRRKKIKYREVYAGDFREEGEVVLKVLHPPKDFVREVKSNTQGWVKNLSLAIKIDYRGYAFLFPGDIDLEEEAQLLSQQELFCQLLKVPRHGAKTSCSYSFLSRVAPQIAVISVGEGNRFHYPAVEPQERLQSIGAKLYRTDLMGAIRVELKEGKIRVEP